MEATIDTNLAAWNAAFAEYVKVTSKQPQEALEAKLNRVGFALFKGFQAHQFGGVPRARGVAFSELAARTGDHRGTTVRSTLMAQYLQTRASLRTQARALKQSLRNFGGTLNDWVGLTSAMASNAASRISAWQDIVGREVKARQAGIGVLGAAFLWYRYRGKGENRHLVLNRRGKSIGEVQLNDGAALIVGRVDGLNPVDARYGVVAKVLSDEAADMMEYVKEKQKEAQVELGKTIIG